MCITAHVSCTPAHSSTPLRGLLSNQFVLSYELTSRNGVIGWKHCLNIQSLYASIDDALVLGTEQPNVQAEVESNSTAQHDSFVYCCLLQASYSGLFSGLPFGLLSALVDIVLRNSVRIIEVEDMTTILSLIYCFFGYLFLGSSISPLDTSCSRYYRVYLLSQEDSRHSSELTLVTGLCSGLRTFLKLWLSSSSLSLLSSFTPASH